MEVYIVLTDTGTYFTKMIKMFTGDQLNHASISFSKELDSTYSFGRKRPRNPFIGGFVQENFNGKLFKHATCEIYSCSVSEKDYEKMLTFVRKIEAQKEHYSYNLIGLFGYLLKRRINKKNAFFCSEFVATTLLNGGIKCNDKPPCFVRPSDIIANKNMKLIYQGELSEYLLQIGENDDTYNESKGLSKIQELISPFLYFRLLGR
ncbi:hypothetical protein ACLM5H_25405 [Fredinandcohnia humi]